jgi:hypothetical protein
MSETEARASDDATPDDTHGGQVAPHEDEATSSDGPADTPADVAPEDASEDVSDDVSDDASQAPAGDASRDDHEAEEAGEEVEEEDEPSWWHRSHPTFAGLVGFFTGVAYVIIVPGVYAALLGLLVSDSTAQKLFPLALLALVVPIAMLVPRKTRRFAQFMFLGIISTAVVMVVTAALVIWLLVQIDG